jgi:hypothetical protein
MRIVLFLTLVLAACGGGTKARRAQAPLDADTRADRSTEVMTGWTKLGERWVDGKLDGDVIQVGRDDGRFRAVTIKVEHSALELYDVRIVFGDGTSFSPETRLVFRPETRSRVIDLPGGNRVIRRVEFKYANLPGGGRAQIELWGI